MNETATKKVPAGVRSCSPVPARRNREAALEFTSLSMGPWDCRRAGFLPLEPLANGSLVWPSNRSKSGDRVAMRLKWRNTCFVFPDRQVT